MKISKEEAVYAVLKMVVDDKISLHMIYNGLWLYNLLVGLGLSTPEVIDANLEIKETILNCLKENFKKFRKNLLTFYQISVLNVVNQLIDDSIALNKSRLASLMAF